MNTKLFVAIVVAMLAGCASAPAEPVTPKRNDREFAMVVVFGSENTVRDKCMNLGAWGAKQIAGRMKGQEVGCAAFNLDTKQCTVYVPEPTRLDDNRTTILGHEVLHCVYGPSYHSID